MTIHKRIEQATAPLSCRGFVLVWIGQSVSQLGNQVFDIAVLWILAGLTHSTMLIGSVLTASYLPAGLLLLGGAWADRANPRRIVLASDLLSAAVTFVFAAFVILGHISIALIFICAMAYGLVGAFFTPAISALFPSLVPPTHYTAANSLGQITFQTAALLGPALSGYLISLWNVGGALTLDAVTFAISALMIAFVRHDKGIEDSTSCPPDRVRALCAQELTAGFRFLLSQPGMLVTIILFSLTNALNNVEAVLTPVLVRSELRLPATTFGLLTSFFGLSTLGGALMISLLHDRMRHTALTICGGTAALGASIVFMGSAHDALTLDGAYILFGLGFIIPEVVTTTLWQRMIPSELRGRVFGVLSMIALIGNPLGFLFAGAIGDLYGPRHGLWIGGVAIAALGVLTFFLPGVRSLDCSMAAATIPTGPQVADS